MKLVPVLLYISLWYTYAENLPRCTCVFNDAESVLCQSVTSGLCVPLTSERNCTTGSEIPCEIYTTGIEDSETGRLVDTERTHGTAQVIVDDISFVIGWVIGGVLVAVAVGTVLIFSNKRHRKKKEVALANSITESALAPSAMNTYLETLDEPYLMNELKPYPATQKGSFAQDNPFITGAKEKKKQNKSTTRKQTEESFRPLPRYPTLTVIESMDNILQIDPESEDHEE